MTAELEFDNDMATSNANLEAKSDPEPPKKRGPGRPKGYPKTGGRQKAVRNWSNPEIRNELLDRSNAIEAVASIARGEKQRWSGPTGKTVSRYPTATEQLQALGLILSKTVPSLQATELTGAEGKDLIPPPRDNRQIARKILHTLASAHQEDLDAENVVTINKPAIDRVNQMSDALGDEDEDEDEQESPPASEVQWEIGHKIDLGDAGSIQLATREGDREQWRARHANGAVIGLMWGRDEASQACRDALAKQQREDQDTESYIQAREERRATGDPFKGRAQHWKNLRGRS